MKIIFLTISLELGGSERRAFTLARYFKRRGFDVEFWGFNAPGIISQMCADENIPCRVVPFQWFQGTVKRLISLFYLLIMLRKARPDILLPHTLIPNTACGFVWRWSGAKKCIGYEGGHEFGLAGRNWETLAVKLTPGFLCNVQHLADEMIVFYRLDKNKIKIVRNGVELPEAIHSRSWWRARLGISEDQILAVMVANLSEFKEHETLIRAWRLVANRQPINGKHARLLLAGKDFGTEAKLKNLVNDLGMQGDVLFLGQVQDISGLIQSVDLGVYSSKREGCPNGVLECMASGLAVAAIENEGVKEALGSHQFPWLSPFNNEKQFAENILNLMQDMPLRKQLGDWNRDRIRDEFSLDVMCKSTEEWIFRV